jgi:hypothetical protein
VTRKQDNARNLFDEKMVYGREPKFHAEMKAVQELYTEKAPGRFYGVRDEFRVGGTAMTEIMDTIESAVSTLFELSFWNSCILTGGNTGNGLAGHQSYPVDPIQSLVWIS